MARAPKPQCHAFFPNTPARPAPALVASPTSPIHWNETPLGTGDTETKMSLPIPEAGNVGTEIVGGLSPGYGMKLTHPARLTHLDTRPVISG